MCYLKLNKMKNFLFTFILLLAAVIASAQNDFTKFLERVKTLPQTNKQSVCDSFYNASKSIGLPRILGDTAYFIYKGNASSVFITAGFTYWGMKDTVFLTKIDGTDLFYFQKWFEQDARIEYKYAVDDRPWIMDPANPNTVVDGWGTNSVLMMPDYIVPSETIEKVDVNKGTLKQISIYSEILNRSYRVDVYLPFGYDASNSEYPTVYFQDGSDYLKYGKAKTVLDNIIDEKKVDPIIAVFVSPTNRDAEYLFEEALDYAKVFSEEILPQIENNYRTIKDRAKRLVIGDSNGASITATIVNYHNDLFKNAGLQSYVGWGDTFYGIALTIPGFEDVKIHYTWGKYEQPHWVKNEERFKDSILTEDHEMFWACYPEAHNFTFWGGHIDDIVSYFFPYSGSVSFSNFGSNSESFNGINFQVYPNPCKNEFNLKFAGQMKPSEVTMNILNVSGKSILYKKHKLGSYKNISLNIENLPKGCYFLQIRYGNVYETRKLIKE